MMLRTLPSILALVLFAFTVSSPADAATAEKMKAAPQPPQKKESKEKGGTQDINIGVGEEPGMQKSQKLKKK